MMDLLTKMDAIWNDPRTQIVLAVLCGYLLGVVSLPDFDTLANL
jgi:hypothetical protein